MTKLEQCLELNKQYKTAVEELQAIQFQEDKKKAQIQEILQKLKHLMD